MVGDPLAWPAMNLARLGGMMVLAQCRTYFTWNGKINIYIYTHE